MFPNLFLVGAPKCGTSALHDYLAGHPDAFMSTPKEPHHFCPDVNAPFAVRDEAAYRTLFKGARGRVVGESSATYLVSRVAAEKIYAASPDARIVALSEHHATVTGFDAPRGTRVHVVPNHVCTTVNLADAFVVGDVGDTTWTTWSVDARGANT